MQDKWIEMKNGRFIGGPKNKKGTTGVWAPVVYLNSRSLLNTVETRTKDPEYDVCYIRYLQEN
jgi:hypothetical protein